jgi:hypothetical protein
MIRVVPDDSVPFGLHGLEKVFRTWPPLLLVPATDGQWNGSNMFVQDLELVLKIF